MSTDTADVGQPDDQELEGTKELDTEFVPLVFRAALARIDEPALTELLKQVVKHKTFKRDLQSQGLPTIPPHLKTVLREPRGWYVMHLAGQVLNQDVKQHNETPLGADTVTLRELREATADLSSRWSDDGCGTLWLVHLLSNDVGPARLLADALLRGPSRWQLETVSQYDSPWSCGDGEWLSDLASEAPAHRGYDLSAAELLSTLQGERHDPEIYSWLTGRSAQAGTAGSEAVPDRTEPAGSEPPRAHEDVQEESSVAEPDDLQTQVKHAHAAASAAAARVAAALSDGGFPNPSDLTVLEELRVLRDDLEAEHGPLGDDLPSVLEALTPVDPTDQLLQRLTAAQSDALSVDQVAAVRDAAQAALDDGTDRDALVALATYADSGTVPAVADLVELTGRLPAALQPAVFALAQYTLELPETPGTAPLFEAHEHSRITNEATTAESTPDPAVEDVATATAPAEEEAIEPTSSATPDVPEAVEEQAPPPVSAITPDAEPDTVPAVEVETGHASTRVDSEPADEEKDLAPGPIDGETDHRAESLVVELLQDHDFGAAAWVARAAGWSNASIDALRAAGYADAMRTQTSVLANRYGVLAHRFDLAALSEHRSLQLLTLAAATRSMLVASYVGGLKVLTDLTPTIDDPATRSIVEALTTAGSSGIEISSQLLAGVRDRAELESSVEEAAEEALRLLAEQPQRKAPFHRATKVWQRWFRDGGVLDAILQPAAQDDRAALAAVQQQLVRLQDDRELSDLIDETDEQLTDAHTVRRNPIEAMARTWLRRSTADALKVVSAWHGAASELSASDEEQRTRAARVIERLRETVAAAEEQALHWIASPPQGGSDFALAARSVAVDLLRTSFDLLLHGQPLPAPEPTHDPVQTIPLLTATGICLSQGEPVSFDDLSVDAFDKARSTSLLAAFDARTTARDHESAQLILDVLADRAARGDGPREEELSQLEQRRADALSGDLAAMGRVYERCSIDLRSTRRQDHIDEQTANDLQRQLERLMPTNSTTNIQLLNNQLSAFQGQLAEYRQLAADRLIDELHNLVTEASAEVSESDLGRVRDLIEAGNSETAVEFMSLLSSGNDLPESNHTDGHLEAFHPALVAAYTQQQPSPRAILDAIRDRQDLLGLSFSTLSDDAAQRADRGLRCWQRLTAASPTENRTYLDDVLQLLGLQVAESGISHSPGLPSDDTRQWFDIDGARPFSGATVHQFGTSAQGRYRVLLTSTRPSVSRLLELAADHTGGRPLIILYIGVLTAEARRELAQLLRAESSRRELVVIDDVIATYLAADGTGRFSTTLACCLPFTGISPYTPYGLGNVPKEMFYGRNEELRSIQDRFGTLFIYGGRQLGKSALLRAAERNFKEQSPHHIAAYVDLKARGVGVYRPAEEIVDVVIELLHEAGLELKMPKNRSQWPDALVNQLENWVAERPERAVLLLLDEVDEFLDLDSPQFRNVTLLKRLFESTSRAVKPVFAGLHQVQRFMSVPNQPLAHLGKHLEIGPLSPQSAFDLITEPLHSLGYRFDSDDTAAMVLSHTNYQPGIIQLFADKLVTHLVRRPVRASNPPYGIGPDDVDAVHNDPDLMQEVRKRFDLTIALDTRYRIIAYTLALHASDGRLHDGVRPETLLQEATYWWPVGFADQTVGSFTTLLEEMVGLGVLSRVTRGNQPTAYVMRSPNTLRLLGSQQSVEAELLEASMKEPQKPFDITVFHRTIPSDEARRSPLDEQQLSRLIERENSFHIVVGSEAAGIGPIAELVRDGLKTVMGTNYLRSVPQGEFTSRLKKTLSDGEADAHRVLVADLGPDRSGSLLPNLTRMRDAVDEHAKTGGERGTLTVVARLTTEHVHLWHQLLNHPDPSITVSVIELARWADHALRVWAEHIERPLDDHGVGEVRRSTGGWVTLIDEVYATWRGGVSWDAALQKVRERLAQPADARRFLRQLGLWEPSHIAAAFTELVQLESGFDREEVEEHLRSLAALEDVSITATLEVLRALQVIELRPADGTETVHLDPITVRAWGGADE